MVLYVWWRTPRSLPLSTLQPPHLFYKNHYVWDGDSPFLAFGGGGLPPINSPLFLCGSKFLFVAFVFIPWQGLIGGVELFSDFFFIIFFLSFFGFWNGLGQLSSFVNILSPSDHLGRGFGDRYIKTDNDIQKQTI